MRGDTLEARLLKASYGGTIGGAKTNKKNKANKKMFYDKEWQTQFGDRNAGQRNLASGHLAQLNATLSTEQRSQAGKLGGKANTDKQKQEEKHFFDKKHRIQRKGNLTRWGAVINGERIPYKKLSSDFVDNYIERG